MPEARENTPLALLCANTSWYLYNFRKELVAALIERGWRVAVAAPDDSHFPQLRALGAESHTIAMDRASVSPIAVLRTFASLFSLYRSLRPTCVHHFTIKPVIIGGIAARILRIPRVIQAITGLGLAFARRSTLRQAALFGYRLAIGARCIVVFQNREDQAELERAGLVDQRNSVIIRGSGVDLSRFSPIAARDSEHPVTFLMACRMLWAKGVREFVDASDQVHQRHPEARFRLLGASDPGTPDHVPESWLRAACESRTQLEWVGYAEDVLSNYQAADVAVLPSYREGVPKSLLEGAAVGLPLLAADVPGCREVVAHGVTGLLVPPRDSEALADAMAVLVESAKRRRELGKAARALVEREFSVEQVVSSTLNCYPAAPGQAASAIAG
ncbi:MAG: glycosyltransferase family 4 protein [Candidatus Latescibacteria bacterium]|nr:glycosyltransferase family 4 protein [Candidatus Latescibacterota bacterium]